MNVRTMIGVIGANADGGSADAVREARKRMEDYAVDNGYLLHLAELSGDTLVDSEAYAQLESRARRGDVAVIVTWGFLNTARLDRVERACKARVVRLDHEVSLRSFPFAYFSLTPEQRADSEWARSVDKMPARRLRK